MAKTNQNDRGWIIHSLEGDRRKSFMTDASLLIVNLTSVDDLKQRVQARHPGQETAFETLNFEVFRPNILIKTGEAYSEDLLSEMRIGSMLLRMASPCIRCNTPRCCYATCDKFPDNEPSSTMATYRNLKHPTGKGVIFGVLCQQELMPANVYRRVCAPTKGFPSYENVTRANPLSEMEGWPCMRVRPGDCIMVR